MSTEAMWAMGMVLTLLIAIIGILLKFGFNQLRSSFDQLLNRIDKISETLDKHNNDLITVLSRNDIQSQFIDSHTEDIDNIKRDIAEINMNCAKNNHLRTTRK
jgi:predicted PurR-regulated permease PerM